MSGSLCCWNMVEMKRRSDNIQHISVWNDLRMKMNQMFLFDSPTNEANQLFIFTSNGSMIKKTITAYSFISHGWTQKHTTNIWRNFFQTETKNIKKSPLLLLFQQKYLAWLNLQMCIHITSRVYNSCESLEAHSMSQRVPAVPCRSRILSCSSIFGTHSIHKLI